MDKLDEFITLTRRTLLLVLAAVTASAVTLYVFSYRRFADRDFLRLIPNGGRPEYHFYTGTKGGRFAELGACVDAADTKEDPFSIELADSTGSPNNSLMVATTRDAFGLVEGRAIDKKDWVAERLQAVAPVSMEKMQVLYNVALWQKFLQDAKAPLDSMPRLSRSTDDLTKSYFDQAVVHAGPTGSGTRQMQSYVLNAAGLQSKRTLSGDFNAELEAVRSGTVAVAFIFSEPLLTVADTIADGNAVRLAAVDPSLVPILFRELAFSPEPTTLVRGNDQAVETIGAYAWLVASKDVPPEDVAKVVHRIATCKTQAAAKAAPWEETGNMTRGLESVATSFEATATDRNRKLWSALGEFSLTVLALSGALYYWLGWGLSAFCRSVTMRRYMVLRETVTRSRESASGAVSKEMEDIGSQTKELLERVQRDCAKGLLLVRHRDGLTSLLEDLERRFVLVCCLYIRQLKAQSQQADELDKVSRLATRWFTLGYIDSDEYDRLMENARASMPPDSLMKKTGLEPKLAG